MNSRLFRNEFLILMWRPLLPVCVRSQAGYFSKRIIKTYEGAQLTCKRLLSHYGFQHYRMELTCVAFQMWVRVSYMLMNAQQNGANQKKKNPRVIIFGCKFVLMQFNMLQLHPIRQHNHKRERNYLITFIQKCCQLIQQQNFACFS